MNVFQGVAYEEIKIEDIKDVKVQVDLDFVYCDWHDTCDPKGQLSKILPDGFRETLPKRVCAKCHSMILPSILGISWASTVIPLMEHGMVMEGESIQTASFKGSEGEAIFGEMNGDTSIISLKQSWLRQCSTIGFSRQEIRVAKAVSPNLCLRLPCEDFWRNVGNSKVSS